MVEEEVSVSRVETEAIAASKVGSFKDSSQVKGNSHVVLKVGAVARAVAVKIAVARV